MARTPFDRRVRAVAVMDLEPSIGRGGQESDHVVLKHTIDAQTGRGGGAREMAAADQAVFLGVEQREANGPLARRCARERPLYVTVVGLPKTSARQVQKA